jgi:hypothetical protein
VFFIALLLVFREIGYIATLFISLEKEKEIFSTPSKIFTIDEEKTKKLHSTLGIKEERIYVVNSSEENAFAGL